MTYTNKLIKSCAFVFLAAVLAGCATNQEQPDEQQAKTASGAHAHHAMHDAGKDDMGRQLYGMAHDMSPEVVAELREREIFPPLDNEK